MGVCGVYLFGSVARGDSDRASDTDVLIAYEGNTLASIRTDTKSVVATKLSVPCTFAEYSRERLTEMFAQGHLFAWHLYQEGRPLDVLEIPSGNPIVFNRPQPYTGAIADATNFAVLLKSSAEHLEECSASPVYEAGIAYVSLRNVGMSLSAAMLPQPIFTRWAPFAISRAVGHAPPCSERDYDQLVAARHASQRGGHAPSFDRKTLLSQIQSAHTWATSLIEIANEQVKL